MIINLSRVDFGGVASGGNVKPEETFDVQPTTTDQTITPTEGSVFSGGTVRAVTSEIDNNIAAGNIKEGVTILGVEGTHKGEKPEESFNVQPSTTEQTIAPSEGKVFSGGTVHAVTSSIDSNIQPENIKEGVSILGVVGTLSEGGGSDVFVVPPEMRFGYSIFTEVPSYLDFSNITNMKNMFCNCKNLTTIPLLDTSKVKNMDYMFSQCSNLTTIPQLDTSKVTDMFYTFDGCSRLTTVEGIDFSGIYSTMSSLFGRSTSMPNLTRFIVNGKIDVSIYDNNSIKALTAIDYDSVKSILEAANRTVKTTTGRKLAFNRTMTDQNGELAALVASCTTKGWTITGLTLQ